MRTRSSPCQTRSASTFVRNGPSWFQQAQAGGQRRRGDATTSTGRALSPDHALDGAQSPRRRRDGRACSCAGAPRAPRQAELPRRRGDRQLGRSERLATRVTTRWLALGRRPAANVRVRAFGRHVVVRSRPSLWPTAAAMTASASAWRSRRRRSVALSSTASSGSSDAAGALFVRNATAAQQAKLVASDGAALVEVRHRAWRPATPRGCLAAQIRRRRPPRRRQTAIASRSTTLGLTSWSQRRALVAGAGSADLAQHKGAGALGRLRLAGARHMTASRERARAALAYLPAHITLRVVVVAAPSWWQATPRRRRLESLRRAWRSRATTR